MFILKDSRIIVHFIEVDIYCGVLGRIGCYGNVFIWNYVLYMEIKLIRYKKTTLKVLKHWIIGIFLHTQY